MLPLQLTCALGCSGPLSIDAGLVRVLQPTPAILEIPSKDQPYDPSQDSILRRVKFMFGEGS